MPPRLCGEFCLVWIAGDDCLDKWDYPESGSIFIIVLWALLLLGALAVALGAYVQPLLRVTARCQQNTERFFIAKAGAVKTAVEIQKYATNSWQCLNEAWANNANYFTEVKLGAGSFTRHGFGIGPARAECGLADEECKININTAPFDVLQNCLVLVGELSVSDAADLAAAIIDWRDADDNETPGGAESSYYEFLTPPYCCKNGKFETMEELCLVKGMTPELFVIMSGYSTVYGRGRVNINTAYVEILKSVGMDDDLIGKIIEFREGDDGKPGTADDGMFKNAGQIADLLSQEKDLTDEKRRQIVDCLDVRSECFSGRSLGRLTGKQGLTTIDFVVDCRKRFWYWREH
ncbi:MAG: hypothetical protein ABIH24_02880 [Verrucomicrobiota bacterium]